MKIYNSICYELIVDLLFKMPPTILQLHGVWYRDCITIELTKQNEWACPTIWTFLNIEFLLFFHGFMIKCKNKNFQIQNKKQMEENKSNNFKHRQLCGNIASVVYGTAKKKPNYRFSSICHTFKCWRHFIKYSHIIHSITCMNTFLVFFVFFTFIWIFPKIKP